MKQSSGAGNIYGNREAAEGKALVTVFQDDDEAYDIWNKKMKVPSRALSGWAKKSNFWMMENRTMRPCSEIIYDQGEGTGCGRPNATWIAVRPLSGNLESCFLPSLNRDEAGKTNSNSPNQTSITGMGLERLTAVIQGVKSNYDTDLYRRHHPLCGKNPSGKFRQDKDSDTSIRVIAGPQPGL